MAGKTTRLVPSCLHEVHESKRVPLLSRTNDLSFVTIFVTHFCHVTYRNVLNLRIFLLMYPGLQSPRGDGRQAAAAPRRVGKKG